MVKIFKLFIIPPELIIYRINIAIIIVIFQKILVFLNIPGVLSVRGVKVI